MPFRIATGLWIALIFSGTVAHGEALNTRLLPWTSHQADVLYADAPFSAAVYDRHGDLWFVGIQNIWRRVYKTGALQRIRQPANSRADKTPPFQALLSTAHGLAYISGCEVTLLREPYREASIFTDDNPAAELSDPCRGLGAQLEGDAVILISSRGVFRITVDRTRRERIDALDPIVLANIPIDGRAQYLSNDASIVYVHGESVHRLLADGTTSTLIQAHSKVLAMHAIGSEVAVVTPMAVFVAQVPGGSVRTIPVAGSHHIVAPEIRRDQHTYLLSDGVVERFEPASRRVVTFVLDPPHEPLVQPRAIAASDDSLFLAYDGPPRLLQFESATLAKNSGKSFVEPK